MTSIGALTSAAALYKPPQADKSSPDKTGSSGGTTQTTQTLTVAKATFSSTEVAAQGASTDAVVNISKSMEKLLDGFTGTPHPESAAADGADDAGGAASGDSASSGAASGNSSSSSASADLARARQGLTIMNQVAAASNAFADQLSKGLDNLKSGFGSLLSSLGAPSDQVQSAMDAFGKDLAEKAKSIDFSDLAVGASQSSTQFTIESHGIDLVVQDGDRQLKISYAKSTLDLHRQDTSLQAQVSANGDASVAVGASTLDGAGKAEGLIINAKGFSPDEVQQVLDTLNSRSAGHDALGSKGSLAVLTPDKKADGILTLKLDLSSILPSAGGDAAATATPPAPGSTVNLTA